MNNLSNDPLTMPAIEWVIKKQKVSITGTQRNFRIGYNRAAKLVEVMEDIGIVSAQGFDGSRTVCCPSIEEAQLLLQKNTNQQEANGVIMTKEILLPSK